MMIESAVGYASVQRIPQQVVDPVRAKGVAHNDLRQDAFPRIKFGATTILVTQRQTSYIRGANMQGLMEEIGQVAFNEVSG